MALTKEKKEARFTELPTQQVDSTIFVEILRDQPKKDRCFSYLYNSGQTYRLVISIPVLGEVTKFILLKKDLEYRDTVFKYFQKLIDDFKIEIIKTRRSALSSH